MDKAEHNQEHKEKHKLDGENRPGAARSGELWETVHTLTNDATADAQTRSETRGEPRRGGALFRNAVSLSGLEPETYGSKVPSDTLDSTGKTAFSADGAAPDAAIGAEVDPDLAAVIEAWPDLPDVIQRGILALATVSPPAAFMTQGRDQ